ncbi:hypothetical protein N7532_006058 [Penicillium argentinense]|uniref:Uncharacterized protein n=1 Tax=Penicillium argentinense TaxID=1131581 RepID=A0A9W9FF65_9EURO|nr:uncharacterized protein N7532_006058 [Penicillium argentinense]KAJ5099057.1 hypothetical protein N7532_006058 [Penicillium argentinense]
MNSENAFKVAIVGDAGVGKSSYIKKHFAPEFDWQYLQTEGYEVTRWSQTMTTCHVEIDLWDVSGSRSKLSERQKWLAGSDAAIIMVDLAQPTSFENVIRWHEELLLANPSGLPVVVCTWKPLQKGKLLNVDPETLLWLGETENVQFYDIAADISRFDQPILYIIRKLLNDPSAEFWFPYTVSDEDIEMHD